MTICFRYVDISNTNITCTFHSPDNRFLHQIFQWIYRVINTPLNLCPHGRNNVSRYTRYNIIQYNNRFFSQAVFIDYKFPSVNRPLNGNFMFLLFNFWHRLGAVWYFTRKRQWCRKLEKLPNVLHGVRFRKSNFLNYLSNLIYNTNLT